jgi:acyl-CoA reductase-like NAD-dependent aldehyde dehydrogenase
MIRVPAAEAIETVVAEARASGARVLVDGKRKGAVHPPVVLTDVPPDCRMIREETFGPVLPVIVFRNLPELIERVNETRYGLQAGLFTQNLSVIKRLFEELAVGTLIVNDGPGFRIESLPFGGVKESGLGREGILAAMEEMTEERTLIF